ncbi:lipase family protein [Rhodococcus sp. IEGM 1366]|uniref:lipase family protein n=1 Tax=Rhodococcus sp. IEGM 1366 TaxID=3082223 RepID=UPI002953B455|nr:lipase family protein [Rhodococcus sp. IEGM 1366]MDV8068630.1 lipase family protein [Rhodococcus sp. IEGM 1366]
MSARLRHVIWGTLAASALVVSSACGSAETEETAGTQTQSTTSVAQALPAPVSAARGVVFEDQPFATTAAAGASARKILYGSTSGVDGRETQVSGTVFIPPGTPPEGGWPIVSVGHGTTGISDDCAPSTSPTLLGAMGLVEPLLNAGYVVAVSDFEGLGTPDPHPYLQPDTAAYNVIDAVRAARNIVPDTSDRWATLGLSQGGQASWAAAEKAGQYGDGLEFVGAANLSPAADISPIITSGADVNLSLPQQLLLPYVLEGLSLSHPDLERDDYVHGAFAENYELLSSCLTARAPEKLSLVGKVTPADTRPATDADADRIHGWLSDIALPRGQASGPMYVVVGANDNLILPEWTEAAVARACSDGDVIEFVSRPGEGHADGRAVPGAVQWIQDRFSGVPAPTTCGA